jgi:hypothetical protein
MRLAVIALLALLCSASSLTGATGEPAGGEAQHRVLIDAGAEERDLLAAEGFDVAGYQLAAGRVEVVTRDAGLVRLERLGLSFEVVETRPEPAPLGAGDGVDGPLPDTDYHDPAEVRAILEQTAQDHPAITRLVSLGVSHEGRDIWGLMISDAAATDEDELTVLFNAAHHAREVMTPEVVLDTIEQLTDLYGTDPDITAWVDAYQIWCVPIVNPDGVARVFEVDDYWRKNVRDNDEDGVIGSSDGVDLNRNYEWGWGYQCRGSSDWFQSATYRGPFEGSEPEAQAMIELGRRIRPVFDVEYHSYGEDVFYALSCDPMFSPRLSTIPGDDRTIGRVIAEEYASRIVQADGEPGYDSAPYGSRVDGTGRDQQYHENGAIAFVTEVNSYGEGGFHPDYQTWRDPTVEGHRPGWRYLLERMGGPAVGGHVVDAASGEPLEADVSLDEMSLPDGKRLTSRADTGRFHLIVVPGEYTLRVEREGYEPWASTLTVGETFEPVTAELTPTGAVTIVYEPFEEQDGAAAWTPGMPGDEATDGLWIWGEPFGTHEGDVQTTLSFGAPRVDATPGEGRMAYVTGNAATTAFTEDDLDGGDASLVSPAWDLSAYYAVEIGWHRWLRKDDADSVDRMSLEVTVDGGTHWLTLDELLETSATADAAPAWTRGRALLDEVVAPGVETRLRFRALDAAPDHVVEAAVDDVRITGYSRGSDGDVSGVTASGGEQTVLSWNAVPGAAGTVYDVSRGDLSALAGSVDLGPLVCIEENSADTSTEGDADAEIPAPGEGFFYVIRFQLGHSTGSWGWGSGGGERSGSGGCG